MESTDTLGDVLIRGLEEAVAYERGERTARTRVRATTAREAQVEAPPAYGAERVRAVRAGLEVSQPVFAAALGVSERTVAAWERGTRVPDGSARRLLQVAEEHPEMLLSKVHPLAGRDRARGRAAAEKRRSRVNAD